MKMIKRTFVEYMYYFVTDEVVSTTNLMSKLGKPNVKINGINYQYKSSMPHNHEDTIVTFVPWDFERQHAMTRMLPLRDVNKMLTDGTMKIEESEKLFFTLLNKKCYFVMFRNELDNIVKAAYCNEHVRLSGTIVKYETPIESVLIGRTGMNNVYIMKHPLNGTLINVSHTDNVHIHNLPEYVEWI